MCSFGFLGDAWSSLGRLGVPCNCLGILKEAQGDLVVPWGGFGFLEVLRVPLEDLGFHGEN